MENKNRLNSIVAFCVLSSSQPPRRQDDVSLKTRSFANQQISRWSTAIQSVLAINQRVNLAIGMVEKIERDSRSKKREKRLRPLGRQSFRMAVSSLLATKRLMGGGLPQKITTR